MDQIHNHYSGPFSVQTSNYQSHYVPAEKPYAVYAFAWEGPNMAIAQHIGTMLTGNVDTKGMMKFEGKAVYRMPQMPMLDFEHCFIPEDMGPLKNDPIHLGFAGDTVGMDTLVKVVSMELRDTDEVCVKTLIDNMRLAGLKVELDNEYKMQDVTGCIDIDVEFEDKVKIAHYVIEVNDGIALRVKIWNAKDKSSSPEDVFSSLWLQIEKWQEIGVTFNRINMIGKDADYQNQVDELLELAKLYGKYKKMEGEHSCLYRLLSCMETIGKGRCFYDDFVMASKKVLWEEYSGYDKDLQLAIELGYVSRDGNILQFLPDLERMATWKWQWLHGEDK